MIVAAPARIAAELLNFQPCSQRTEKLFEAFARTADAAGVDLKVTNRYRGVAPLLMLWGPGAPDRLEPMRHQIAAGGHVACWDLAYWNRDTKVRVSIDAAHPQAWVMRRHLPSSRFKADRVLLEDTWTLDGPVIVAGIGEKATAQYGQQVAAWEAEMIVEARARGRKVLYRPKNSTRRIPVGVQSSLTGDIDKAIRGASLVVTWHSNVAVDAIRLGIPVICRDGAAAAVCSSTWPDVGMPQPLSADVQQRFMHNLAWFQWGMNETEQAWRFLIEAIS